MSKKFLVTGGCGFIGAWVLRALCEQEVPAVALDVVPPGERCQRILGGHPRAICWEQGDLLDLDRLRKMLAEHRITHLIHLAALLTPACHDDPVAGCRVNVLGSVTLMEAIRRSSQPIEGFSYASSFAVYGPEEFGSESAAETVNPNRPPSFYGAFKLAVDLIAEQYWRQFGLSSLGIRPHVVYGPERDQGLSAAPSLAIRAAVAGLPYTINFRGRLGYDYVEDVARAFVRAALQTPRGANVVDLNGEQASSEEFARAIERLLPGPSGKIGASVKIAVDGPEIPSNIPPQPRYIQTIFPDWLPTSLEDGIRRTGEYYRSATSHAK
jgi:nucleoside-diphosphate-sugar epimerase